MAELPDPWRAVVEVVETADKERAAHLELAARLRAASSRFGSVRHDVEGLLDDVDRRAVIDVDAPVTSARPVVPQLKLSVRKAVAFVTRHLAQQTTVVVTGLSAAVRLLDQRVQRLEGDGDSSLLARIPDLRPRVAEMLDELEAEAPRMRRDVGSQLELATVPAADAGLVIAYRILDIGPLGARIVALDRLVAALVPSGRLAIVSADPARWPDLADAVTRDLTGPGPLHAETWSHLLAERGGTDITVHAADGAHVVTARW
jgi:hypothetical protein